MYAMKGQKCFNCGAPFDIPNNTEALLYECPFCKVTYRIKQDAKQLELEAQMFELEMQQYTTPSIMDKRTMHYVVAGVIVLMAFVPLGIYIGKTGDRNVSFVPTKRKPEPATAPTPPESEPKPFIAPSGADESGVPYVNEQIDMLLKARCKKLLLPHTTSRSTRRFDIDFSTKRRCMHILASTGKIGQELSLSVMTPSKESIETLLPSYDINFTYCPKKTGKHSIKIVAHQDDAFTAAVIECPRNITLQ